jgi:transposase
MLDGQTGEVIERRLEHATGEARAFYAALPGRARVGMEATGYAQWFEGLLAGQGHELWVGDAAEIHAARVRKQKTDSRDACHLLDCCCRTGFRGSGLLRRRSGTYGNCYGIGTSWFAHERR